MAVVINGNKYWWDWDFLGEVVIFRGLTPIKYMKESEFEKYQYDFKDLVMKIILEELL